MISTDMQTKIMDFPYIFHDIQLPLCLEQTISNHISVHNNLPCDSWNENHDSST